VKCKGDHLLNTYVVYPSDDGSRESCNIFYSVFVHADSSEDAMDKVVAARKALSAKHAHIHFDETEFRQGHGVEQIHFIN